MELTLRPSTADVPAEVTELRLSGMRVHIVQAPWQQSLAAILRVGGGYGDDPADRAGLAHVCEHERITHAAMAAPGRGAAVTGLTGAAWTDYEIFAPVDDWQTGLRQLMAILHPDRLVGDRLANEVRAVLIEMARSTGRPALRLGPLLAAAAATDPDIAATGRATPESVSALTAADIDGFLRARYSASNCRLIVSSPVASDTVAGLLMNLELDTQHEGPSTDHEPNANAAWRSPPPRPDHELSGTLAMTIGLARPGDPAGLIARQLAHAYLTDRHGLLDRISAPFGARITGSAVLTGRRSEFTVLSWGSEAPDSPLVAALSDALHNQPAMTADDLALVRNRLFLTRSFALQTPIGLARSILRWAAGEDAPPMTADTFGAVPAGQVHAELGNLSAARLWHIVDGLPRPLEL